MTTASELAPQIHVRPRATVRYELHGNQAADLAEQLLTLHPPTSRSRFVCYPLAGTGRFADLGRTIELEVFGAVFGNDRAELEGEYGPTSGPAGSSWSWTSDDGGRPGCSGSSRTPASG